MRIEEYEVMMLLLSVGVLVFGVMALPRLRRIEKGGFLVAALAVFFAGVLLTVVEGFFAAGSLGEHFANHSEHLAYLGSMAMLTLWCWWTFVRGKEASE